uniref:Secreted protein n=1 Tax=Knipowitschia caucasica TaxID=637954 RepID=A0AAV2K220_KNICA
MLRVLPVTAIPLVIPIPPVVSITSITRPCRFHELVGHMIPTVMRSWGSHVPSWSHDPVGHTTPSVTRPRRSHNPVGHTTPSVTRSSRSDDPVGHTTPSVYDPVGDIISWVT